MIFCILHTKIIFSFTKFKQQLVCTNNISLSYMYSCVISHSFYSSSINNPVKYSVLSLWWLVLFSVVHVHCIIMHVQ